MPSGSSLKSLWLNFSVLSLVRLSNMPPGSSLRPLPLRLSDCSSVRLSNAPSGQFAQTVVAETQGLQLGEVVEDVVGQFA